MRPGGPGQAVRRRWQQNNGCFPGVTRGEKQRSNPRLRAVPWEMFDSASRGEEILIVLSC